MTRYQSILITGASSGIGASLARAYAGPGMTLLLTARNDARLAELAADCRARGAVVKTASIDVTENEKLAAWMLAMDDAHAVDLLIANAGISAGGFEGETFAGAQAVFDVNLQGVLNTIHPLIPRMVARGQGQVAIMSSLAGIHALPSAPAYSASKAAVRFYADALRPSLGQHGVHVSVICPGWIRTPLTDKNTFPMPLIMSAERAARIIQWGIAQKKTRISFPKSLYFLLRVMDALPRFITAPLFARLPSKQQET
jgi:short-subunit dehydrogenase